MIRDGYGVEDIAYEDGCPVEQVRMEVQILREEGELSRMFGPSERIIR
jgi:hypothetical protein